MQSKHNIFKSAFDFMPTPAFVIERVSGKIVGSNQGFRALFANQVVSPPEHWLMLSATSSEQEKWDWLSNEIDMGSIDRCQENIQIGDLVISTELGFQSIDDDHYLACVYSTDYMDLSSAENTLLKFALTESSSGLWLWETEGDLVVCSESISMLLGCEPIDAPQSTEEWHSLVHANDIAQLQNTLFEHLKANGDYYEEEYRIRRSDGTYLWVKERGRTYSKNSEGKIAKIIGFMEDISSQKALEEHLRNQATYDELTGLLNHGAAISHFKKQLGLAKRQYTPLIMVKINIGFDECLTGLSAQDKNAAIRASSQYVYSHIREADVLARVEPEKLLLLLPNTSIKEAQKLLSNLVEPDPILTVELTTDVTRELKLCAGMAVFPEDGETIEELAESANIAVESCLQSNIKVALN
ncbi:PAS domain-containing protein [Marinomonas sp. 2405UD68-3]|uniref:PAS domain-containing protein n=1 Tax=Marinomonas sp. 2405UD68-3 TaxID=3391835 RepID=UPI0039C96B9E